jgi:hypothetical protein
VRYYESLARLRKIEQPFARGLVVNDGPDRHFDFNGVPVRAGLVAAFAVASPFGFVLGVVAELEQRVLMARPDQDDIASAPAVTAARTTARNILLSPERETAIAAVAGFYQYSCFVEEQHRKAAGPSPDRRPVKKFRLLLGSLYADELAHPAPVLELDHARNLREQRIVLTPTNVQPRLDLGAALPDDDRPARNQLTAEHLHAEPLRVRIAPVFGTA